jgi:hypothetical protein
MKDTSTWIHSGRRADNSKTGESASLLDLNGETKDAEQSATCRLRPKATGRGGTDNEHVPFALGQAVVADAAGANDPVQPAQQGRARSVRIDG